MYSLSIPQKPFKLGLFIFLIYFVISILWLFTGLPAENTKILPFLLFAIFGFQYGKNSKTSLALNKSFLVSLYFTIPLVILNFVFNPLLIDTINGIPRDELAVVIFGFIVIFMTMIGIPLFFNGLLFHWMSKFGKKQSC